MADVFGPGCVTVTAGERGVRKSERERDPGSWGEGREGEREREGRPLRTFSTSMVWIEHALHLLTRLTESKREHGAP